MSTSGPVRRPPDASTRGLRTAQSTKPVAFSDNGFGSPDSNAADLASRVCSSASGATGAQRRLRRITFRVCCHDPVAPHSITATQVLQLECSLFLGGCLGWRLHG